MEGQGSDCVWRRYKPILPVWDFNLLQIGEQTRDYVSWNCSDWSELQTTSEEELLEEDYDKEDIYEHPHGWEPCNTDELNDNIGDDAWDIQGTTTEIIDFSD